MDIRNLNLGFVIYIFRIGFVDLDLNLEVRNLVFVVRNGLGHCWYCITLSPVHCAGVTVYCAGRLVIIYVIASIFMPSRSTPCT